MEYYVDNSNEIIAALIMILLDAFMTMIEIVEVTSVAVKIVTTTDVFENIFM